MAVPVYATKELLDGKRSERPNSNFSQGGFSAAEHQVGAAQIGFLRDSTKETGNESPEYEILIVGGMEISKLKGTQLADGCNILSGKISERTPEVFNAMELNAKEGQTLFPSATPETGSDPIADFIKEYNSPAIAAYRYLMGKEGFDNYSQHLACDLKILNAADPTAIGKLDAFAAAHKKIEN